MTVNGTRAGTSRSHARRRPPESRRRACRCRRGVSTVDYVMALVVILPMVVVSVQTGPKIMRLVYEMTSVLVSSPFM